MGRFNGPAHLESRDLGGSHCTTGLLVHRDDFHHLEHGDGFEPSWEIVVELRRRGLSPASLQSSQGQYFATKDHLIDAGIVIAVRATGRAIDGGWNSCFPKVGVIVAVADA